ncbi:MAG: hypothetical protein JW814_00510 [Candidatus Krumholzibacteriota bacterium]|nr:hypothetical protein [Candidatus Krumholzibacteriota bacterium]
MVLKTLSLAGKGLRYNALRLLRLSRPRWHLVSLSITVALSAIHRLALALSIDPVSYLGVIPKQGEMGMYNEMAASRYIDTIHGPLYPAFLMAARFFGRGDGLHSVFIIQSIVSVAMIPVAFFSVLRAAGKQSAVAAAILAALYPSLIIYNLVALPITFVMLLLFLIVLTNVSALTDRTKALATAVISSTGVLLDPMIIFFIPGTALIVKKKIPFLLLTLLLLLPWGIRNSMIAGRPVLLYEASGYGIDLKKFNNPFDGWKIISGIDSNISFLAGNAIEKSHMPVIFGKRTDHEHITGYSYIMILLAGSLGIFRFLSSKNSSAFYPPLSYLVLIVILTQIKYRYRIPLEPFLIIYTSILAGGIWQRMLRKTVSS